MPNIAVKYFASEDEVKKDIYRSAQAILVPYIFVDVFNVKTGELIKRYFRDSIISIALLRPATEEQINNLVDLKTS